MREPSDTVSQGLCAGTVLTQVGVSFPATLTRMPVSAPRLDPRLLDRLDDLERSDLSFAEIRRSLVIRARELGIPPPSYETVRRLAGRRRIEREITADIRGRAIGVAIGTRHPAELVVMLRSAETQAETQET